jgi:2-amino-4-hydroxy-6-hydroxymethyldihydropteridine diphosphokinase
MERVFLSLGSNLGDRVTNLRLALAQCSGFAKIVACSHVYETEPVEFTAQPWFANAVVAVETDDAPQPLLERLLAIEISMGRRRDDAAIPKGPRVIDLDIILFGDLVIQSPSLTLPHPAMHLRRFVLEPLAEIAPEAVHPVLHQTAAQLLRALRAGGPAVRRMEPLSVAR